MRIYIELPIIMRDGIILYGDLYCPDAEGKFPTVIWRLPGLKNAENRQSSTMFDPQIYADRGICVLIQDQRGTGVSDGLLTSTGLNEFNDGYDTIEWVASQPWSNKKVGLIGSSNAGFAEIAAASMNPPHLIALTPWECQAWAPFNMNFGGTVTVVNKLNWLYRNSKRQLENMPVTPLAKINIQDALSANREHLKEQLTFRPLCDTPAANIPDFPFTHEYVDTVCRSNDPEYWRKLHRPIDFEKVNLPMMHLTGWFDFMRDQTIDNFQAASLDVQNPEAKNAQFLIIGPWSHGISMSDVIGDIDFGTGNNPEVLKLTELVPDWFKYYFGLGGLDPYFEHRVHYYVVNQNAWREADSWPPREAVIDNLYFDSDGYANSREGHGRLVTSCGVGHCDTYIHDPDNPVPTKPGVLGCDCLEDLPDVMDYSEQELREDILVYTGDVLEKDLILSGYVKVELYSSTTAEDADYMARLLDVDPDGKALNITEGAVRARYRNTYTPQHIRRNGKADEQLIPPGEIFKHEIFMGSSAWCIKKGHQLRVEIASSNFPRNDINPGTSEPVGCSATARKSCQTVYHTNKYPSKLVFYRMAE